MRRVLVFGPSGAGKTTFATALAERLGVPAVHYYANGFDHPPEAGAWLEQVAQLAAGAGWVMDGTYAATLGPRLKACDAIVVLDYPRWRCLWGLVERWWAHRGGKVRREMPATCPSNWSWEVVWSTWEYSRTRLPKVLRRVAEEAPGARVWRFASRREAAEFLEQR